MKTWSVDKLLIGGPWGGTGVSFTCLALSLSLPLSHAHIHSLSSQLTRSIWNKGQADQCWLLENILSCLPNFGSDPLIGACKQRKWGYLDRNSGNDQEWTAALRRTREDTLISFKQEVALHSACLETVLGWNYVLGMKLLHVIQSFPGRINEVWNCVTLITKTYADLQVWELEDTP